VLHENKRRWLDVCAEAAICDDSERLNELACEINEILSEEERRLEPQAPAEPYPGSAGNLLSRQAAWPDSHTPE